MQKVKPEPEFDSSGCRVMTEPFLKQLCRYHGQFETPRLNDQLFLHYYGFAEIANLDAYKNLTTLWLENNLIKQISGLDSLTNLRCLYLQNNSIEKIENLGALQELLILNLADNRITTVENLSELEKLEELVLSKNRLSHTQELIELQHSPSIKSLDISNNSIEDTEYLFSTLCEMLGLRSLILKGNRCIRHVSNYRKTLIARLTNLHYLDDRPIEEVERLAAETWYEAGPEAEKQVRRKFAQAKEEAHRKGTEEFVRAAEELRDRISLRKAEIIAERKVKRADIQARRAALGDSIDEATRLQLDREEKALDEPINEANLLEDTRMRYTCEEGELDRYGHVIPEGGPLKHLDDLSVSRLEELLLDHCFDFEKVDEQLRTEFASTPAKLREKWTEHEEETQIDALLNPAE